jgi:DNA-binding IclR family transcriptional regulator
MTKVAVTAVERVLDIVEAFRAARRPLSLTDLADSIRTPKSSCHAIVSTLIARGYLYTLSRPRALYPTRRLHDLTREILQHDPFIEDAMPLLEQLRDSSRETVIFGKRQGDAVVYLQVLEGPHSIRYSAAPGEIKPLHSSAIGKSLLGSLKEPELRALLHGLALPAITGATLVDRGALHDDVMKGRKLGYYVTKGENVADVWAVAASLVINGETLALAIAGPRHRMETSLPECARLLVATCNVMARPAHAND